MFLMQVDCRSVHQDSFGKLFCKEVRSERAVAGNSGEFVGSQKEASFTLIHLCFLAQWKLLIN